jgi:hypothetical protein
MGPGAFCMRLLDKLTQGVFGWRSKLPEKMKFMYNIFCHGAKHVYSSGAVRFALLPGSPFFGMLHFDPPYSG